LPTPTRGGRSADRRSGACGHRLPARDAAGRELARLPCLRPSGGRAPIGAPPWRFSDPGPRYLPPAFPPGAVQPAPGSTGRSAGRAGSVPAESALRAQPRHARPRSAFRIASRTRPLIERGWMESIPSPKRSQHICSYRAQKFGAAPVAVERQRNPGYLNPRWLRMPSPRAPISRSRRR
jgi:hypothetical protein